jgi:hypothetical protein
MFQKSGSKVIFLGVKYVFHKILSMLIIINYDMSCNKNVTIKKNINIETH